MSLLPESERPRSLVAVIAGESIKEIAGLILIRNRNGAEINPEQQQLLDMYDGAVRFADGLAAKFPDFYNTLSEMIDMVLGEEYATMVPMIQDPVVFICWQPLLLINAVGREVKEQQPNLDA